MKKLILVIGLALSSSLVFAANNNSKVGEACFYAFQYSHSDIVKCVKTAQSEERVLMCQWLSFSKNSETLACIGSGADVDTMKACQVSGICTSSALIECLKVGANEMAVNECAQEADYSGGNSIEGIKKREASINNCIKAKADLESTR